MSMEPLIVTVPPARIGELRGLRAVPAHQGYRIGRGPHLFRAAAGPVPQGGLMALDCVGFDGRGEAAPLCDEVVRECAARGFRGAVCDFEQGGVPLLDQVVRRLGEGRKKSSATRCTARVTRSRPKRSAASSRRRDSEPPDRADGIITRARGELCP